MIISWWVTHWLPSKATCSWNNIFHWNVLCDQYKSVAFLVCSIIQKVGLKNCFLLSNSENVMYSRNRIPLTSCDCIVMSLGMCAFFIYDTVPFHGEAKQMTFLLFWADNKGMWRHLCSSTTKWLHPCEDVQHILEQSVFMFFSHHLQ